MTHSADKDAGLDVAILAAIKAVRAEAADERAALHDAGEPLTDYGSGLLDGLDRAWLAGVKAARRPVDTRETTSLEEWWACEDAFNAGVRSVTAGLMESQAITPTCRDSRTDGGAWDEAVRRLREIYDAQIAHDPDLTLSLSISRVTPPGSGRIEGGANQ